MKTYDSVISAVRGTLWAILPNKLDAICGFLERKAGGLSLDAATIEKVAASNRTATRATVTRSIGVLPVVGVVSQRMNLLQDFSGGVSTEQLGRDFDALVASDEVGAIILDMDSPGGNYAGTPELASKIHAARGAKPIIAVANSMAASAAYWIAAAADEIVVTPSGEVGSIGVLAVHEDVSAMNETMGVKRTYVTYGEHKAEFNPDSPLADSSREELQRRVDQAGETFVKAVARYRNVTAKAVMDRFGQGRMFDAAEAVERGMADRIDTLEGTVARLAGVKKPRQGRKAWLERERLELEKHR